jgi:hypothetical protein
MAIVKANYVKRDRKEKHRAKATIRYMQHRPGKEGKRIWRTLFGSDGLMERQEAYELIDTAEKGTIFFRFVLSPDPAQEDRKEDLDLRALTEQTMNVLTEKFHQLQKSVQWVAAVHADHAPHRHVNILSAVPGRLTGQDFDQMREAATTAAVEQRTELDRGFAKQQQGKEAGWHLPA